MFYLADAALFLLFVLALLALGLGALAPQRSLLETLVLPALATLGALGLAIWIVGSFGIFSGVLWAALFVIVWLIWMFARRQLVAANARRVWPALRGLNTAEITAGPSGMVRSLQFLALFPASIPSCHIVCR